MAAVRCLDEFSSCGVDPARPFQLRPAAGRAKPASGEMAEWTIAPDLKSGERESVPEVRILLSPL